MNRSGVVGRSGVIHRLCSIVGQLQPGKRLGWELHIGPHPNFKGNLVHAGNNKKRGRKKRRPLAGPNHRSVFFKKNGGRSGAAIINRTACSVFSRDDPDFAISYFLI